MTKMAETPTYREAVKELKTIVQRLGASDAQAVHEAHRSRIRRGGVGGIRLAGDGERRDQGPDGQDHHHDQHVDVT